MTSNQDAWSRLSEQWQGEVDAPGEAIAAQVAASHRRATRRLWGVVLIEFLVVLAVATWTAALLWRGPRPGDAAFLGFSWFVVAVAVAFSWWNRRGIWHPTGVSTADYLALCEARATRKLRTARFVVLFVLALATVTLLGAILRPSQTVDALLGQAAVLATLVSGYLAWAIWFRGRARREQRWVQTLREQLHAADEETDELSTRL